jgi:hypothetical protein
VILAENRCEADRQECRDSWEGSNYIARFHHFCRNHRQDVAQERQQGERE